MMRLCLAYLLSMLIACAGDDAAPDTSASDDGAMTEPMNTSDGGDDGSSPVWDGVCAADCVSDDDCERSDHLCHDGICLRANCEQKSCEEMGLAGLECVRVNGAPACVFGCEVDADCNKTELVCLPLGDDGTRLCAFDVFCSEDADCADGLECHPVQGKGMCIVACDTDEECDPDAMCLPTTDDGNGSCVPRQCTNDADCAGRGSCRSGFCRCDDDGDCDDAVCFIPPG